jgi:hypothetical protein
MTFQLPKKAGKTDLAGTDFFYFTDNMMAYCIINNGLWHNPALHSMVLELNHLELELQCHIEVVHVPGTAMIGQGTDGLSHGLWCTNLQQPLDQGQLVNSVFASVPYSNTLTHPVYYCHWGHTLGASQVLHCLTIWCPPPEIAAQIITFVLHSWTKSPRDTGLYSWSLVFYRSDGVR